MVDSRTAPVGGGAWDRRADRTKASPKTARRAAKLRGIQHDKGLAIADPADLLIVIYCCRRLWHAMAGTVMQRCSDGCS